MKSHPPRLRFWLSLCAFASLLAFALPVQAKDKPNSSWEALLASSAPDLVGPLKGLRFYVTLDEAQKLVPALQKGIDAPKANDLEADTFKAARPRPAKGPKIKRLSGVQLWLPGPEALDRLKAAWGAPGVARSASGTFYTWINKDKGLRATYWKDPHNRKVAIPRLIISPWVPLKSLFGGNTPHLPFFKGPTLLGITEAQLDQRFGNQLAWQNGIYRAIILGAVGVDSRSMVALVAVRKGVVDSVEIVIPYDEDPNLLEDTKALLGNRFGYPTPSKDPYSGLETVVYRAKPRISLTDYPRQKAARLTIENP